MSRSPVLVDAGDYYWADGRQIPLLQIQDEVAVRWMSGAGEAGARLSDGTTSWFHEWNKALDATPGVEIWRAPNDGANRFGDEIGAASLTPDSSNGLLWSSPVFIDSESGLRQIVSNEVIVALTPEVDPAPFFATETFTGYRPLWGTTDQFVGTLSVGGGLAALAQVEGVAQHRGVRWASPNFVSEARLESAPNDTLYSSLWHLKNTGQTGVSGADANLEAAWETTTGSPEIVIAIFDDGVQTNHPDLFANIWVNPYESLNSQDSDGNGWIDDLHGLNIADGTSNDNPALNNPNPTNAIDNHGTSVAGVAAAVGNNSLGVTGAAYNAKIMPIKFITGNFFNTADLGSAIYYAAGRTKDGQGTWRGADIANHSYTVGSHYTITEAFDWAATNGRGGLGVANFVATGNSASGLKEFTISGFWEGGNFAVEWRYTKNSNDVVSTGGSDQSWLAAVSLPGGNIQTFTTSSLPTGWSTSGNANWTVVSDPAKSSVGLGSDLNDSYVARSGSISHNQSSVLRSPTFSNAGTLKYWAYTSVYTNEVGHDGLEFWYSTNGGSTFTQVPSFFDSRRPSVNTAISYPANLASTIAVGASNDFDYRSHYSQYGTQLDFVAPSGGGLAGISTTDRTGAEGYNATSGADGDFVNSFGGTSSASPLAAGIGALLLSKNPNLTAAELTQHMRASADKIGGVTYSSGFNQYYGYGRVNAGAAIALVTADTAGPTVTSIVLKNDTGVQGDFITSHTSPTLTLTFNERTVWSGTDITITAPDNSTIIPASYYGSGTKELALVLPALSQNGTYTITLSGTSSFEDQAQNKLNNGSNEVFNFELDTTAPAVTSITSSPLLISDGTVGSGTFTIAVLFSEAMNTSVTPVLSFPTSGENPAGTMTFASGVWSNGSQTYTATYNVADANEAIADIDVRVSNAEDSVGNALAAVTLTDIFSIDTLNPRIQSIVLASPDPTNAASVQFTVTFDESVDNVDAADFTLNTTGVSGAAITSVSGSGVIYTVSVNTGSGNGTINLDLVANPTINDLAGNALQDTAVIGADETYTINKSAPTVTLVELVGSNLTILDQHPDGKADSLVLSRVGGSIRVFDASNSLSAGTGVTQVDANTVEVLLSSVTGQIIVDTIAGDDLVTIDFTGGNPIPAGGLSYDGGTGNDSMAFVGGGFHTTTFTAVNSNDGSILLDVDGDGLIVLNLTYSGLDTIQSAISSNVVQMNYTGDDETISVSAASTTQTLINSTAGVSTTFVNPSELLVINATEGKDIIELHSLAADFSSLLIAGTDASDVVRVLGSLTFAANHSVTIQDVGAVDLLNPTSQIAVSGAGSVNLTSFQRIRLDAGAAITAVDGDISVAAHQQTISLDYPFVGVSLDNATIHSSGLGNILVAGRGGGSFGNGNHGVRVIGGGSILSSGGGSISVTGVGGASPGSFNIGVLVRDSGSQISSNDGPIFIEGHSNGLAGLGGNIGVYLHTLGVISHTGTNPNHGLTVIGSGGAGLSENHGVWVKGVGSRILSSLGPIVVEGNGGTAGSSPHHGVFVSEGGAIRNLGAATTASTTVRGWGGNLTATAWGNRGVYVTDSGSEIFSDGGTLRIEGTAGGSGSSQSNVGLSVSAAARIISENANVFLQGIGGNSTGTNNHGVLLHGTDTLVRARGGDVQVEGTAGGGTEGFGIDIAASAWIDTGEGAGIGLIADSIRLAASALVVAGADNVELRPLTPGTAIGLGEADTVGILGLTDAELDVIFGNTVIIGDPNSGSISVTAPISHRNHLELVSAAGITISESILMDEDRSFSAISLSASDPILLDAVASIATTGSGAVVMNAVRNIALTNGTSITTVNGGISLQANQQSTPTAGNFIGIDISNATIEVIGTGQLSLWGRGGDSGSNQHGVRVQGGGQVNGGSNTVRIRGFGGLSLGSFNDGVSVAGLNSRITSTGGAVDVEGTGGGVGNSFNFTNIGVRVASAGVITNSGTASPSSVTVKGFGGNKTGSGTSFNYGVTVTGAGSQITSSGGNVVVEGMGGGSGTADSNYGVYVIAGGIITTTGTASNVTVKGFGGNTTGTGSGNIGVFVSGTNSRIDSIGGAVEVEGTGGGAGTSDTNFGVLINSSGVITGAGTVTVKGIGGNMSGSNGSHNFGVMVSDAGSQITSIDGNVFVEGTGGGVGSGTANYGVFVQDAGLITSAGSASTVSVKGLGGNSTGTGNLNRGVLVWGTNSRITSSGGAVMVEAVGTHSTEALRLQSSGAITSGNNATITIDADSVILPFGTAINSGTGTTVLRTFTDETRINLGGANVLSGSPLTLGLTDDELDRITAGTLVIGDASSGEVKVTGAISRPATTNMELHSGDSILFETGTIDTAGGNLLLHSEANGVQPLTSGTDINVGNGAVTITSPLSINIDGTTFDTQHSQLNVAGTVDLNGVGLLLTGTYTPLPGDEFTIVSATSILGQFNGLSEGAQVSFGGVPLTVHYSAGAVTLKAPSLPVTIRYFDFDHGTSPVTADGYQSVLIGNLYSADLGYGWNGSVSAVLRAATSVPLSPPALLQDKHSSSAVRSFFVSAEPGAMYNIRVFMGDTVLRDQELSVDGGATFTRFTTSPHQYIYPVFTNVVATSDRLEIRVRRISGSWAINGMEVIEATGGVFRNENLSAPPVLFTGLVHPFDYSGVVPGEYWVSTNLGTVLDSSGNARNRISVASTGPDAGRLAFSLQSFASGFSEVVFTSEDGLTRYELETSFELPALRRLDMDHGSEPSTADSYHSVLPGVLYSASTGLGWSGSVSSLTRDASLIPINPTALFQDKHTSSSLRSFFVAAEPGRTYNIRVFLGDTLSRDQEISIDGGATFTRFTTGPNQYLYPLFSEVTATSNRIEIQVRRVTGSWVMNGIEVIDVTGEDFSTFTLPAPPPLQTSSVHPLSFSGIAAGTYWVSADVGRVIDSAAAAIYRVTVLSSGELSFAVQSFSAGVGQVTLISDNGLLRYELPLTYFVPTYRGWDFDHSVTPATTADFQSVVSSDLYSTSKGYGWSGSVSSLTRDASLVSINPTALFQDKHTSSSLRSFFVAAESGRTYNIRVFLGDTLARDQELSVDGGTTFTRFTTGANQYLYPLFSEVVATSDRLEIQVRRVTGSWVMNGIEVIDVTGEDFSTFTLPAPPPLQTSSVHPLSFSGIAAGTYWVSADVGRVIDSAAAAIYRVTVLSSGELSFAVQSFSAGVGQVTLISDNGLLRYELPLTYFVPTYRGWDFDHSVTPATTADFQSVVSSDLYSTSKGYGWSGSVSSLTRDASLVSINPTALFQDKHTSSSLRSFFVAAEPGRTYNIRVFLGDTLARDQELSVDGGATFTRFTTGANQYLYPLFSAVTATSDRLEIQVRRVTGSWVINGIEVIDVTGQSFSNTTLSWPEPLETSVVHTLTFTGIAAGNYWVSTNSGRVLGAGNQTLNQVVVTASGELSLGWQNSVPGGSSVWLVSSDGLTSYELVADFFLPAARFYDFDHSSGTITADEYQSVLKSDLYTLERGYGWNAAVSSLSRTTGGSPVALYRDKHHSTSQRSFFVTAVAGVSYDLRLHLGDTVARDVEISVDGGLTFTRYTTAANEYISPQIPGVIPQTDRLEMQIRQVGTVAWAINGLEVIETTSSAPSGLKFSTNPEIDGRLLEDHYGRDELDRLGLLGEVSLRNEPFDASDSVSEQRIHQLLAVAEADRLFEEEDLEWLYLRLS